MVGKLVAKHLAKLPDGWHSDGRQGLYLRVRGSSRIWVFRYRDRVTGKLRDMGLGALNDVSLSSAREKAKELRDMLAKGTDPLRSRRVVEEAQRVAMQVQAARHRTLAQCRDAYVKAHAPGWRNAKHAQQWVNTLDTYAGDLLNMPVHAIDTAQVLGALEPIWATKTETATRVRQRLEALIDWATARKYRSGDNPARWRGHLDKLLPAVGKVKRVTHRAALPYGEMAQFMAELVQIDSLAAKALRMQILTATRPSEACGARWDEIDLAARVWTIPADRMKAGREHRVPLSAALVAMLEAMPRDPSGFVFPGGGRTPAPITTAATLKLLKSLRPGIVPHGFRSTFRDWAADQTNYPRDLAEATLAHTIKDKTEAAYRRLDMLERRARLMEDWARYCMTLRTESASVTPIRVCIDKPKSR